MTDSHHQHSDITPLGGSSRRQDQRSSFVRSWTGYVPLIRACPHCGAENSQQDRFCLSCATSLAEVEPTPSNDPHTGVRAMEERIHREADEMRRQRTFSPDSGTGLVITGILLVLITVWLPLPWILRTGLWAAGLALAIWGLLRMRADGGALRRTGLFMGAASVGLVALVVTRGSVPADPILDSSPTPAPTSVVAAATPAASPVSTVEFANLVTLLGDARHSGMQPGPAPHENPSLAWRFDSGSEILASPIVADGTVFFTNREGFLYAVDAESGSQLWRVNVGPYVLRTTPTFDAGTLYLVAGFDALALDAETGDERWRVNIRYAGTASPTIAGDTMFVVSQEGLLYALDVANGSERWRATTDGISFGSPAFANGTLIVATDRGKVVAVNSETGRARWQRDFESPIYTTPVITGDTTWIVTTDGRIHGLAMDSGEDRHELETTADIPVTAHDDLVFAPSVDGGIYALNTESGNVLWFASLGGEIRAGPVRTSDQVIAAGGNRIAGFDIATGKQAWYFLAGDTIEAPPAVTSGYVFFGARDGLLYAINDRADP